MSLVRDRPSRGKRRGRPRSKSAPAVLRSPKKVQKRKQWSEESMQAALDAVKSGVSVLRAAREHCVPRQTLRDRVSGRVIHGTKPGPKPYLSSVEETELAHFLVDVAKAGYGKSRSQIKGIAERVAADKAVLKQKKISDGWFRRFMERQPCLTLRKGDATANVRMDYVNKETMTEYFNLLKNVLMENELMESPNQIYNVDETGMPLDHRPPKVVTKKGQKKVRCRTSGNKSQITVIGCVSATGQAIPPFVIFDAKSLNMEWRKGEIPGTTYGLSDKGWVDAELFKGWLTDHLLKHAVGSRPLLVLLDGHSSHYQPDLIRFARENDIILFCLPPHTSHESQPLDVSVFKPLKSNWQDECHNYMQSNPGKVVTKYQFSDLLNKAWHKTMTPSTICAGFRRSGVFPFNPDAIDCTISANVALTHGLGIQVENGENCDLANKECETQVFSAEQEQVFQKRYTEGYDLPDPVYRQWLTIHHPELVSAVQHVCVPPSDPDEPESLTDLFSYVAPQSPLTMSEPTGLDDTLGSTSTSLNSDSAVEPAHKSHSSSVLGSQTPPPTSSFNADSVQSAEINPPSLTPGSSCTCGFKSPGSTQSSPDGELSYISKYLVQFVPSPPTTKASAAKRVSGARVLTSAKCAAILEEREEKKRKEQEEKDKRKAEREQKKKEREEIAKKKAEERVKRAKQLKRQGSTLETNSAKTRKTTTESSVTASSSSAGPSPARSLCAGLSSSSSVASGRKDNETGPTINVNECCVCYRTFDDDRRECTGSDWVECVCKRWLHEDCVCDIEYDVEGRELLCPYCVV